MICVRVLSVPALLIAATLVSCTGLGRVPTDLVDLYDQATPAGLIEIEVDRNGVIREMEADISPDSLPANIREAALRRLPGATITGAERELKKSGAGWEVKLRHDDREWEVVLDGDGKVIELEKELKRSEAPEAVLQAADREIAGGEFKSVEVIMHGDGDTPTEYHVKKMRDGASYKIVLAPDGALIRKVREARAEIEIPLKG